MALNFFEDLKRIAYFAYVRCEKTLWVSDIRYNGIYSIDMLSGQIKFAGGISGYVPDARILHSFAVKSENLIFFLPQLGNSIDEFNTVTGEVKSYHISIWDKTGNYIVAGYVYREDRLFIIPRNMNNPIGIFYFKTGEFEIFQSDIWKGSIGVKCDTALTCSVVNVGNSIWVSIFGTPYIAEIDLVGGAGKLHELPIGLPVQTIGYDGSDFWLGQGFNVLRWNPEDGIKERYENIIINSPREDNIISQFLFHGDDVYIFPQWFGVIRKINKKTKEIYNYDLLPADYKVVCDGMEKWRDLRNAYFYNDEIIVNPINRNMELHIKLPDGDIYGKEYLADSLPAGVNSGVIREGKERGLYYFLNMLLETKH